MTDDLRRLAEQAIADGQTLIGPDYAIRWTDIRRLERRVAALEEGLRAALDECRKHFTGYGRPEWYDKARALLPAAPPAEVGDA